MPVYQPTHGVPKPYSQQRPTAYLEFELWRPARRFNSTGTPSVFINPASSDFQMAGAWSMAFYTRYRGSNADLWQCSTSGFATIFRLIFNASGLRFVQGNPAYDQTNTSLGGLANGEWGIWGVSRAAGAATTPRLHLYRNGAWTHADFAVAVGDNTLTVTQVQWASTIVSTTPCDHAVSGFWNGVNLSDANYAALTTNLATSDWLNNAGGTPNALYQFNQADASAAPVDLSRDNDTAFSGTGAEVINDGPVWNYDLAEQFPPYLVQRSLAYA